jgi:hypothetical protein
LLAEDENYTCKTAPLQGAENRTDDWYLYLPDRKIHPQGYHNQHFVDQMLIMTKE